MELTPESRRTISNRLKRAQGQLLGIIRMLEEGDDCEAVLTQLAAVGKALDRAGFQLVSSILRECIATDGIGGIDLKRLEKAFLSLS